MNNTPWWEDDIPLPEYHPDSKPKLEIVKPTEHQHESSSEESSNSKKVHVDMTEILERCKKYYTLNSLLSFHRSEGQKVVESLAFTASLASLSYLYSHSFEVGNDETTRKMSLNLFFAIIAETGYQKTGYFDQCRDHILPIINGVIQRKYDVSFDSLSTYLPASVQGLQRICADMPTRFFGLDEAKDTLKARDDSPRYQVFEVLRRLFDPHVFGLSVTKKAENNNKQTDRCIATVLIASTTNVMKKHFLTPEKLQDGTANRFLIVAPSSNRTGSKKPIRIKKEQRDKLFDTIQRRAEEIIHYKVITETIDNVEITRLKRAITEVYCEEIEKHFEAEQDKIDIILDDYEERQSAIEPKILMLTRQVVMKKRLAYILWLDQGLEQCAASACSDAEDIVRMLNQSCESLLDTTEASVSDLRHKILSLREKKKGKIYISTLVKEKGLLDERVYGNLYKEIEVYLRTLATLDQIELYGSEKKITAFCFIQR